MEEHKQEKILEEKGVRGAPLRSGGGASITESTATQEEQEYAQRTEQKSVRGRPAQKGGMTGSGDQGDLKSEENSPQLEQRAVRALPAQRGGMAEQQEIQN